MKSSVKYAFFIPTLSHCLSLWFKLGGAITEANVIYYPGLRMESRNTIELHVSVRKKYVLQFHNYKMNYEPSIIHTTSIHIYFYPLSSKMLYVIEGMWIFQVPYALIKQTLAVSILVSPTVIKFWFSESIYSWTETITTTTINPFGQPLRMG